MCDETVGDSVAILKLIPDWFTRQMNEVLQILLALTCY